MKQTKTLYSPSFFVVAYDIQEAIQDGWEINEEMPPVMDGFGYEVNLKREVEETSVKLTRAQILEKARAARKLKAESTGDNQA